MTEQKCFVFLRGNETEGLNKNLFENNLEHFLRVLRYSYISTPERLKAMTFEDFVNRSKILKVDYCRHSVWYQVQGTWYRVRGTRCLAPGNGCQAPGARHRARGTWREAPGARHRARGTGRKAPGARYSCKARALGTGTRHGR